MTARRVGFLPISDMANPSGVVFVSVLRAEHTSVWNSARAGAGFVRAPTISREFAPATFWLTERIFGDNVLTYSYMLRAVSVLAGGGRLEICARHCEECPRCT